MNTNTAAAVGMLSWLLVASLRGHKPSITGGMTGAVAGLATVTPAAGFVPPWAALVIGLLAGAICYFAVHLRTQRNWDDALDVWGVHGVGGALGTILTGFFASSVIFGVKGAFEGGWHQLWVQIAGVAVAAIYAFVVTFLILKAINLVTPLRVPKEVEYTGLDEALHGESAYIVETPPPVAPAPVRRS